jgi:RNA polymerase sigma-70 factor (ECF subfamily)
LDFHSFNEDYLRRLASGDSEIESHFTSYFGDLLSLKLRYRVRSPQLVEDIRQETLLRVLQTVRKKGIEHPERFGAFVSAVCNNVQLELGRGENRHEKVESFMDPVDNRVDLDAPLVDRQTRARVQAILDELPEKDRDLLRMYFLEECGKDELLNRFGVGEDYLRVLLHRAKGRFRAQYSRRYLN